MRWCATRSVEILYSKGLLLYQLPLLQEAPRKLYQLKILIPHTTLQTLTPEEPSEWIWILQKGVVHPALDSLGSLSPLTLNTLEAEKMV